MTPFLIAAIVPGDDDVDKVCLLRFAVDAGGALRLQVTAPNRQPLTLHVDAVQAEVLARTLAGAVGFDAPASALRMAAE